MIVDQQKSIIRPTGLDEENILAVEVRPFGTDY